VSAAEAAMRIRWIFMDAWLERDAEDWRPAQRQRLPPGESGLPFFIGCDEGLARAPCVDARE
jgi:hypothetical protein